MKTLRDMLPKTLPTYELSPFEQGVLAGQQMMVNKLDAIIKAKEPSKDTKDK